MGRWRIVAVLAVVSLTVQFYGLYRMVGPAAPAWFPQADKVEHGLGFALPVLLVLLALTLRRRAYGGSAVGRRTVLGVAAVFVAYAVLSEIIQHLFYRYRTGDPLDVLADSTGIAVGLGAYALVLRTLDRSRAPG